MSLFPPRVADVRRRPLFGCCSSRFLPQGFASGTDPNATRHSDVESPGRLEWAPYATWSHSYLDKKNVLVSSGKLNPDKITEGADISTHTQQTKPVPSGCSHRFAFKTIGDG